MTSPRLEQLLIEAMAKHLPPSGASLHLLDVGGKAGEMLSELRADLVITAVGGTDWPLAAGSMDAVVAFDCAPDEGLLRSSLAALRPGGRFILIDPGGEVSEEVVRMLEAAGYTRILVEAGIDCPTTVGVLMRGEKPHTTQNTQERIRQVAQRDESEVIGRGGRYVHLLVRQQPNKPAWTLQPGETVEWQAVAVAGDNEVVLLAFSSLPKAVAFMQPAVLAGRIQGVNKVAKFRWEIARSWPNPILLNPTDDILETHQVVLLMVDPSAAEAPDE